jgi:glycosyltransferase involved in cell wall biosynthesis
VKLVFFSPMAVESAIARVTALVTAELLGQGHEVVVVRTENEPLLASPMRKTHARITSWRDEPQVRDVLQSADAVFYQVGDNYAFHRGCVEWLPKFPGVVCLHDYYVGSLFSAWASARPLDAEAVLRSWYGADAANRLLAAGIATSSTDPNVEQAPLTEWIASMASAVLTHSSWGIARVLAACPGPVQVAALPYDAPRLPKVVRRRGGEFMLLTVGHINKNKRPESVIRAIAGSEELRSTTTYRLVGHIEPEAKDGLQRLAASLHVKLSIDGHVADAALQSAYAEADVVSCLRLPTLEAASASAIEAMLYGKPVLVMNVGFYEELPDDVVAKVSPNSEVADIRHVLEDLLRDRARGEALGERAAAWASATFRADTYAKTLVEICGRASATAPIVEAARYYVRTLAEWAGNADSLATSREVLGPLKIFEVASRAVQ